MSYLATLKNVLREQNPQMSEADLKDSLFDLREQVDNARLDAALAAKRRYQKETPEEKQDPMELVRQQNLAMMTAQEIEMSEILQDLLPEPDSTTE